ncbi:hypothetical protein LX36DRAFT_651672 [Colletotrichum falcatum]|nr:hypothetical protein LX36DRAFT_651672 [Colletotrichum falcatum]
MAEKSCEVSIRIRTYLPRYWPFLAHRISINHLSAPPSHSIVGTNSQRLVLYPQARRQCGGGLVVLVLFLYRGSVCAGNCQKRQPS